MSIDAPLRVAQRMRSATRSAKVPAPIRLARKRTGLWERNVRPAGLPAPSVRSSSTSYAITLSSSARLRASERVRLGTPVPRFCLSAPENGLVAQPPTRGVMKPQTGVRCAQQQLVLRRAPWLTATLRVSRHGVWV
jgi:hypothetical protein